LLQHDQALPKISHFVSGALASFKKEEWFVNFEYSLPVELAGSYIEKVIESDESAVKFQNR